ncbi:MAG TPA: hypothetical protein VGM94_05015 [Galbitalea sp.]|jgi:hypothetical protein
MTNTITNWWAALPVGLNWDGHKAEGLQGGTDYEDTVGLPIKSPADGTAYIVNDGLNSVEVQLENGIIVTMRELASRTGSFPRPIKRGGVIGTGGRLGTKWLHVDATVNGVRVPFESVVTPVVSTAGVSKVTSVIPPEVEMKVITNTKKRYWLLSPYTAEEISGVDIAIYEKLYGGAVSMADSNCDRAIAAAKARGTALNKA